VVLCPFSRVRPRLKYPATLRSIDTASLKRSGLTQETGLAQRDPYSLVLCRSVLPQPLPRSAALIAHVGPNTRYNNRALPRLVHTLPRSSPSFRRSSPLPPTDCSVQIWMCIYSTSTRIKPTAAVYTVLFFTFFLCIEIKKENRDMLAKWWRKYLKMEKK
jgi:hypothetical protein